MKGAYLSSSIGSKFFGTFLSFVSEIGSTGCACVGHWVALWTTAHVLIRTSEWTNGFVFASDSSCREKGARALVWYPSRSCFSKKVLSGLSLWDLLFNFRFAGPTWATVGFVFQRCAMVLPEAERLLLVAEHCEARLSSVDPSCQCECPPNSFAFNPFSVFAFSLVCWLSWKWPSIAWDDAIHTCCLATGGRC